MNLSQTENISVGKYLVSPLTRLTDGGTFAPSVSIRSGKGQATHDRVLRFHARFATRESASRYAALEGLSWLQCHLDTTTPIEPKEPHGQGRTD